jgi:hypothetical protein
MDLVGPLSTSAWGSGQSVWDWISCVRVSDLRGVFEDLPSRVEEGTFVAEFVEKITADKLEREGLLA